MLAADLFEYKREFLNGRDNDLLAGFQKLSKVAGMFRMADCRRDLGKLFDCIPYLLVEEAPVSDYDDRIENRRIVSLQADELMGEPGNGVTFAAAC